MLQSNNHFSFDCFIRLFHSIFQAIPLLTAIVSDKLKWPPTTHQRPFVEAAFSIMVLLVVGRACNTTCWSFPSAAIDGRLLLVSEHSNWETAEIYLDCEIVRYCLQSRIGRRWRSRTAGAPAPTTATICCTSSSRHLLHHSSQCHSFIALLYVVLFISSSSRQIHLQEHRILQMIWRIHLQKISRSLGVVIVTSHLFPSTEITAPTCSASYILLRRIPRIAYVLPFVWNGIGLMINSLVRSFPASIRTPIMLLVGLSTSSSSSDVIRDCKQYRTISQSR